MMSPEAEVEADNKGSTVVRVSAGIPIAQCAAEPFIVCTGPGSAGREKILSYPVKFAAGYHGG